MATIYTHKSSNIRKTWLLMTGFLIAIVAIGYAIAWYMGDPSIVFLAVIFAVGTNVFSYWNSDTLVLKMTGARPVTREEEPLLYNIVENLSIAAGLPMPKVCVIDDPAPNAFATGRDENHAAVVATKGLLSMLDRSEIEGVMAHELAHIGNRDMLLMTVAVVLAGFVAIVADFMSRALWMGGGDNRDRSPIFLIVGIAGIILAPIAAKLIQMSISRNREYLADSTAALLTRYPEGLASALEKISGYGHPMQKVSHATAHLFISDPDGNEKKSTIGEKIQNLFSTHPPSADRIRLLRDMGK
jgi:heat shock protein HtpX